MPAHTTRSRVRFHDVDHAGIIFFAHVQRHCHDALEEMMRSLDMPLETFFERRDIGMPLVDAHARYHKPYRHGDVMVIEAGVERLGERSVTTRYDCLDEDGTLCARVRFVQCCIELERFRPTPIPDDVRAAFERVLVDPVDD